MAAKETKKAPWAMSALWSPKAPNKCTAAILDTVLLGRSGEGESGPQWLFTSKNGEVTKKRTCTGPAVLDRFQRLMGGGGGDGQGSPSGPTCALLRFTDGRMKLISTQRLEKLAASAFPPSDPALMAVQSYIPSAGQQGTMYRNTYRVVNDKGRITSVTHSFTTLPHSQVSTEGVAEVEPGEVLVQDPPLSRSKANRLNQTLDSATKAVVRFIETARRVRIISIAMDYIVDKDSQLWLAWVGDASVAVGDGVMDLTLAGVEQDKGIGRDSWIPKHAQDPLANDTSPTRRPGSRTRPRPLSKTGKRGAGGAGGEGISEAAMGRQVGYAAQVVEAPPKERKSLIDKGVSGLDDDDEARVAMGGTTASLNPTAAGVSKRLGGSNFPSVDDNRGDFAGLDLREPQALSGTQGKAHPTSHGAPGASLLSNPAGDVVDEVKAGDETEQVLGMARVSYQSIVRARDESQKLANDAEAAKQRHDESWREYPLTPTELRAMAAKRELESALRQSQQASGAKQASAATTGGAAGESRSMESSVEERRRRSGGVHANTTASDTRNKLTKMSHGNVMGGAARLYEEVSVSQKDMQIYALLDRARRLRERQETIAKEQGVKVERSDYLDARDDPKMRLPSSQGMKRARPLHPGDAQGTSTLRESAEAPEGLRTHSRAREQLHSRSMSSLQMTQAVSEDGADGSGSNAPHTWKDRLTELEEGKQGKGGRRRGGTRGRPRRGERDDDASVDPGSGSVKASMKKFEKLDEHLRGKMDPYEAKRLEKEAAVERSLAHQKDILSQMEGGGDDGTYATGGGGDGESGASLGTHAVGDEEKDPGDEIYFASVLLCDGDRESAEAARTMLEAEGYFVDVEWDGKKVIEILMFQEKEYDVLLIDRNSPVADAYEVTEAIRRWERERRLNKSKDIATSMRGKKPSDVMHVAPFVALPIIAYTAHVEPDDLRSYMDVGMDGCVSKPLERDALLATIRAAAPQHARPHKDKIQNATTAQAGKMKGPEVFKMGPMGVLEGSGPLGSAAMAAQTMSLPSSFTAADGSVSGVLQLDADTSLPYAVIDYSMSVTGVRPSTAQRHKLPLFNLVVCHDIFDTLERTKLMFAPVAKKYPGLQVLVWNYPGQAFTEWREEQLLNNEYFAACLQELLDAVGPEGSRQFDTDRPFHLVGYGNGACVSAFYACHYNNPQIRSVVSINGYAFVDPHLAGALHDCMNVFSCAPPARPDLPVYFFSRFLFSPAYLAKVSSPLALNLYTAVHNPISLQGRIQLCLGALSHMDLRELLPEMDLPIIAIQSTQGALVKPVHSEVFVEHRRGGGDLSEARSIHEALKQPHKTCVVWIKSGHEVFQEAKEQVQTLVEQMATGYHETHDVSFLPAVSVDANAADKGVRDGMASHALGQATSGVGASRRPQGHGNFEDAFIDNVLGKVNETVGAATAGGGGAVLRGTAEYDAMEEEMRWREFSSGVGTAQVGGMSAHLGHDQSTVMGGKSTNRRGGRRRNQNGGGGGQRSGKPGLQVLDASAPSFERQDNSVYSMGKGSRIYPSPNEMPEVKEYMTWRLKRNKKRLQRLDQAARIIQGSFRAYLAYTIVKRLREARAAQLIQRLYRGWKGRLRFLDHLRTVWASQVVQRAWRGFAGRKFFRLLRRMHAAAAHIQRVARGFVGRLTAGAKREAQRIGAVKLQQLWRRRAARKAAFELRRKVHGARTLQRAYRGHLGRRRAAHEREKYLFSKSQSQGIEFGRQMLLEHKLHATRLQSEVQLLTQEKVGTEEQVEALLEEISEFEEAVTQLEKEMHDLSKIETEAVGVLDEEGRFELREQKMRLDREFGEMLAKIGDRRERLSGLEGKLATLDRARQGKEEELRTLERKLVVLLDEQQRELESIKRRQEKKGELLLKTQNAISGKDPSLYDDDGSGGGPGGKFQGPSAADKKQAAQLMQSTETLMKFGFMSMSMTYFSSLNMVRAMRNVSATDTVMAALHENATASSAHVAGMGDAGPGGGGGGAGGGGGGAYEQKLGGEVFKPALKPGQMPGDEPLKVSAWAVEDVARWLQTLSLGQYREAFMDAAVDGAFLYDLDDDDLKNTLGIEHKLHRKKILNVINKLKIAEAERNRQIQLQMAEEKAAELGLPLPSSGLGDEYLTMQPSQVSGGAGASGGAVGAGPSIAADPLDDARPPLKLDELVAWVRHGKLKKLKEALDPLPSKPFDKQLVAAQYVEEFGTAYVEAYEREPFNMNKTDEFGNTLLIICSQNGNLKVAKLLVEKGANPDHQNKEGQTAGHFANSYGFYDMLSWMFAEDGAAGNDTIMNRHNMSPYDGLRPEIEGA